MQAKSFTETHSDLVRAVHSTGFHKALLLVLNFIPVTHLAIVVSVYVLPFAWPVRVLSSAVLLYLLPPILARLLLLIFRIPEGTIAVGSKAFFAWWTLLQFQMVFNRLTFLEELLRIIPGLYSNWLRLWGARIGRFTYWAPGMLILDRSFLDIGNDVAFGAGVRLNAHVIAKNENGEQELILARIHVGDRAFVGGYSLLTAGTVIAADEATRACLVSSPFSEWKSGKRVRK